MGWVVAANLQNLVVERVVRQLEGAQGATQLGKLDEGVEGACQKIAVHRTGRGERFAQRQVGPQRPADGTALVEGDRACPLDENYWRGRVGFYAYLCYRPSRFHQVPHGRIDLDGRDPGGFVGVREVSLDVQRKIDAVSVEQFDHDLNRV